MKHLIYIVIFAWMVAPVLGDWIQPPLQTESGKPVPQPDVMPQLPRAHGAHPDYAIEWWYWVGHLQAVETGERFGFQSTVFRLAGEAAASESEAFGNQQLYMSHAALSDLEQQRYYHQERVYREGWQASAALDELGLRVGPIEAQALDDGSGMQMSVRYAGGVRLDLILRPTKPMVRFGERGVSRKGSDPAAVSWYWTYTRIEVTGTLQRAGESIALQGVAWMDHEISSSQLGSELEGWDWTAIQLDDGTEVKAYRLRGPNEQSDPWSAVYWIDADAQVTSIYAKDFTWEALDRWRSPDTGVAYPTRVRIRAMHPKTGQECVYELRPLLANQEFVGNDAENAYWEGACEVFNEAGERVGVAYLELAGYSGGLGGKLN
ncbi:MAG: putative secreted hydrolase [Lentimonas sp.]|jgi:predicted secreted hydrolase